MTKSLFRRLALGLGLALALTPASAQQVPIQPYGATMAQGSGTIAATNTFQAAATALAYGPNRLGGFIQNTGTAMQFVQFLGKATDCTGAVKASAIQLQPPSGTTQGGSINFNQGLAVERGLVCITGTQNDTYSFGVQ